MTDEKYFDNKALFADKGLPTNFEMQNINIPRRTLVEWETNYKVLGQAMADLCEVPFKELCMFDVMHCRQKQKRQTAKKMEILLYIKPYLDHMWAATIAGILLDCDFRDSKQTLEKYLYARTAEASLRVGDKD